MKKNRIKPNLIETDCWKGLNKMYLLAERKGNGVGDKENKG